MAENETVAAILAAGMLQPISPPASGPDGSIEQNEQTRFVLDVMHAVALYRAVLETLDQTSARRVRLGADTSDQAEHGDPLVANFTKSTDVAAPAASNCARFRGDAW